MYVKRFTGQTVSEALRAARRELGEETLLLGTRRTSSSAGPATEITVAIERPEPAGAKPPAPKVAPSPRTRATKRPISEEGLAVEVAPAPEAAPTLVSRRREIAVHDGRIRDLEARFDLLSQRIRHLQLEMEAPALETPLPFATPAASEIVATLVESGLGPDLSDRAALSVLAKEPEGGFAEEESFLEALAWELSLFVPARKASAAGGRRIVALLGPTGTGKTTTAAKLAARAAVLEGKDVALVTADDYRIGAVEQLREYSGAIGVPLEAVRDAAGLAAALARNQDRELIVIDTPGVPRSQGEHLLELGRLLEAAPEVERRLVISATTRARDIVLAVSRFRALGPVEIVFSKMDETSSYGELLSSAANVACPVAGIATGRGIPDDYEETTPERLAEIVVRSAWPFLRRNEPHVGES